MDLCDEMFQGQCNAVKNREGGRGNQNLRTPGNFAAFFDRHILQTHPLINEPV